MNKKRVLATLFALIWTLVCAGPVYAVPPTFTSNAGTSNPYWGIDGQGPLGAVINDNGGVLEAKNAANSALIIFRSATPVGANDVATKSYVDTKSVSGDVSGTLASVTVSKIQGNTLPAPSTGCLQWTGSNLTWASCGSGSSFTAGTDLSGTSTNQTVVGFQGRSVLSAGPTTGNAYYWNGSAWAATSLSLAGGSAFVSGVLPIANGGYGPVGSNGQLFSVLGGVAGWNSLGAGDLTLSTSLVPTVTGLGGITLPTPPGSSTTILQDTAGVLSWASPASGTSVTGTGVWYSAAGSLNAAAVGVSGDASIGALSGGNIPFTITGLRGSAVPSLTAGYLHYNGTSFVWDSSGVQTVVFQPGGTAGANVYTTWSPLVTAANAIQGPVEVFFDGSHNSNAATIPSGAWSFTSAGVRFRGPWSVSTPLTVTCASGATISGVNEFDALQIASSSTAAVMSFTSGTHFLKVNSTAFTGSTTAPFFSVTGGGTDVLFDLLAFSGFGDGAHAAVTTGSGATSDFELLDGSSLTAGSLTGAGTTTVHSSSPAATNGSGIATTLLSLAGNVSYNDSTLPAFGTTQVQGALDYLKGHAPIFSTVTTGYANWTGSAWALTSLPTSFSVGGDLSGTTASATVVGLKANALPALTSGYLQWTGSAWALTTPSGTVTAPTGSGLWHNTAGSLDGTASHGTSGQILVTNSGATDTPWVSMSGDATLASTGSITLSTVNGTTGTFGSSSLIPVITANGKGLVTSLSTATIAAPLGSATGNVTVAQGGTGLTTLLTHGVLIGEGTSNVSGVALGDAQLLVGQTSADPLAKTMSGDATFTDTGALTLATVNSTTGSFGTSSTVPIFTVNGKGLMTTVTTATIAAPLGSATGHISSSQVTAGSNGQVFMSNGGTSLWNTFSGDVTVGGAGITTVNAISGGSPIVISNAPLVAWSAGLSTPELRQFQQTSNVAASNLFLTPQHVFASATGTNGTPGSLIAALGAPVSSGVEAAFEVTRNNSGVAWLGPVNTAPSYGGLYLGTNTGASTYTLASNGTTTIINGAATEVEINAGGIMLEHLSDNGAVGGIQFGYNGTLDLGGGRNVFGISPVLTDFTGATTNGIGLSVPAHNALELNGNLFEFSGFQSTPTITQIRAAASNNGGALLLLGQQGGTGNTNGGEVDVIGGTATGSGTPGAAVIADGSETYELFVTSTGGSLVGSNWSWLPSVANPKLGQLGQTSNIPTNNMFVRGQGAFGSATGSNEQGGGLTLAGGAGVDSAHGGTTQLVGGDTSTGFTILNSTFSATGNNSLVLGESLWGVGLTNVLQEDIVSEGQGTVNTQQTTKRKFRSHCRLVANNTSSCLTLQIPTGVTAAVRFTYVIRDVTSAGSANDASGESFSAIHNVSGTVSQVGNFASSVPIVAGATFLTTTNITISLSGGAGSVTYSMQLGTASHTYDVVLDGEVVND